MNFIKDESAQVGSVTYLLFGIFIIGITYVALSPIPQTLWSTNNDLIANPDMQYSQEHYNAMDDVFKFTWAYPIFVIILFVIYAIKKALDKQEGSAY